MGDSLSASIIFIGIHTYLHPMWAHENMSKSNKLGFHNVTGKMIRKYADKSGYQQYRYEKIVEFNCCLCKRQKKSKLVVILNDNWSKIICNSCYGNLRSQQNT